MDAYGQMRWKGNMMSIDEIGMELCELISEADVDCEDCPFTDKCSRGSNGAVNWLRGKLEE